MSLPELPKQNKKQEADFGVEFRHWWDKNSIKGTFELKDSRGKNSIPFSCFEEDQETVARLARSSKGVLVRVSVGTPGTADYIGLIDDPTYIAIRFPSGFYLLSIEDFIKERDSSNRKSLTEERCREIGRLCSLK